MSDQAVNEIELLGGCHIREAIARAVAQAIQTGARVRFNFNGEEFVAEPNDTYESAKARWTAQTGVEVLSADEEATQAHDRLETMRAEAERAISEAKVPTEQEMREAKVPWPNSIDELVAYITTLVKRPHDYGTCVYAMSMAAVAAFNYVCHELGTTGFQASCADLDIIRRTRLIDGPFKIVKYDNMLYPQYERHFEKTICDDTFKWLQEAARKRLTERDAAAPSVVAHWQSIADGNVPFGYELSND